MSGMLIVVFAVVATGGVAYAIGEYAAHRLQINISASRGMAYLAAARR